MTGIQATMQLTQRAIARLEQANPDAAGRWTCPECRRTFVRDGGGLYAHARCCTLLRQSLDPR